MKDLLPAGSVVLLKNGTKKLLIIGVMQVNPEQKKMYDYLGVPYPEGYVGSDNNFLFNDEDVNDIVFRGYDNPEREDFMKLLEQLYKLAVESPPADNMADAADN